jgi:hypothetical protein
MSGEASAAITPNPIRASEVIDLAWLGPIEAGH